MGKLQLLKDKKTRLELEAVRKIEDELAKIHEINEQINQYEAKSRRDITKDYIRENAVFKVDRSDPDHVGGTLEGELITEFGTYRGLDINLCKDSVVDEIYKNIREGKEFGWIWKKYGSKY